MVIFTFQLFRADSASNVHEVGLPAHGQWNPECPAVLSWTGVSFPQWNTLQWGRFSHSSFRAVLSVLWGNCTVLPASSFSTPIFSKIIQIFPFLVWNSSLIWKHQSTSWCFHAVAFGKMKNLISQLFWCDPDSLAGKTLSLGVVVLKALLKYVPFENFIFLS